MMTWERVKLSLLVLVLLSALSAGPGFAQNLAGEGEVSPSIDEIVSSAFSYQGLLTEDGEPVTGSRGMVFRFYSDDICLTQVGSEISLPGVQVIDGFFSVELAADPYDFDGQGLWLEVDVEGTVIACQEILPVPYALSLRPGAMISGSGDALLLNSGLADGLVVQSAGWNGLHVSAAGWNGLFVSSAEMHGVAVLSAGDHGVVAQGGSDADDYGGHFTGYSGVYGEGAGAEGPGGHFVSSGGHGVYIESGPGHGIQIDSAGHDGVRVDSAETGFHVASAEFLGLAVGYAGWDGVLVSEATQNGIAVTSAGYSGVSVGSAGSDGVHVESAGQDGLSVASAQTGVRVTSAEESGVVIANAGQDGLEVTSAEQDGVRVVAAGVDGVCVEGAGDDGVHAQGGSDPDDWGGYFAGYSGVRAEATSGYGVYGSTTGSESEGGHFTSHAWDGVYALGGVYGNGVYAESEQEYGVYANTHVAGGYGFYTADKIYTGGGCVGCTSMLIAQNGSDEVLEPGQVVAVVGVASPPSGTYSRPVLLVRKADSESSQGVIGVVEGRYLSEVRTRTSAHPDVGEVEYEHAQPTADPAAPGELLTVVYRGMIQVQVDAWAGGVQVADLLVASSSPGHAMRAGAGLPPGSFIGKALEPLEAGTGLIWVLVDLH